MKFKIEYDVSDCMECPKREEAQSTKRNRTYNICLKAERLLPEPLLQAPKKENWGLHYFVIEIPDWCPFKHGDDES